MTGDRYAGEFPRELFRKHGISYQLCEHTKSDLFRNLLPRLNSGTIALPRNDRLIAQLVCHSAWSRECETPHKSGG